MPRRRGQSKSARVAPKNTAEPSLAQPRVLSARHGLEDFVPNPIRQTRSTARLRTTGPTRAVRSFGRSSPAVSPTVSPSMKYRALTVQEMRRAVAALPTVGSSDGAASTTYPLHSPSASPAPAPRPVPRSPSSGPRWKLSTAGTAIASSPAADARSLAPASTSPTHNDGTTKSMLAVRSVSNSRSKTSVEVTPLDIPRHSPPLQELDSHRSDGSRRSHPASHRSNRSVTSRPPSARILLAAPLNATPLAPAPVLPSTAPATPDPSTADEEAARHEAHVQRCLAVIRRESRGVRLARRIRRALRIHTHPAFVTPNILLGDRHDAANRQQLDQLGVSHVLIAARQLEPMFPDDLTYLKLQLLDAPGEMLSRHFPTAFPFLDRVAAVGGRCLVHCIAGVSRSVALVIAYLVARRGMTLADALARVRSVRTIIPNEGFRTQLAMFELQVRGRSSVAHSRDPFWNTFELNRLRTQLPASSSDRRRRKLLCF